MADSVSSTSFLLPGSSNRMFGLASGLDIDSMVSKLMQAEEVPLNQLKQQQQLLQWKQDDYRSMNSLLLDLYNSTFDMTLQSNYQTKTAVSTNDSLVTATASSTAGNSSYSIKGGSLAKAANITSTAGNLMSSFDPSKSLWENRSQLTNALSYQTLTISGAPNYSVSADGTTFNTLKPFVDDSTIPAGTAITVNNADSTTTTYSVVYDKSKLDPNSSTRQVYIDVNTGDMVFDTTLKAGSSIVIPSYSYGSTFDLTTDIKAVDSTGKLVDKSFSFTADQSLNDMIDEINDSGLNVTAFYGSGSKQISITSKSTGNLSTTDKEITVTGTLFNTNFGFSSTGVDGTDATLDINGVQMQSNSNTFNVNGVTFNLNADIINDGTTKATVNITNDSSGIFDKIKSWVDKYNDTIKQINDKISQKKYRDYPPLTDEQKKSMNDKDIDLWNEKAMSGMLSNDTILPGGLDQMRMDIYTSVGSVSNSDYDQLADIGITTSSDYTDNGKLVINEAKLKAAIAADPTSVMNLFTNNGIPAGGTKANYDNEGIMLRLQTSIQNTMDSIYDEAGKDTYTYDQFSLGKSIHSYDTQISDMMKHLQDVQNRYYSQFTAMEQAIQQANQQGSFISQNFAG